MTSFLWKHVGCILNLCFGATAETLWQMNMRGGESIESGSYPQRPGEPDCAYYLRTGLCRYGLTCRYNHPPNRKLVKLTAFYIVYTTLMWDCAYLIILQNMVFFWYLFLVFIQIWHLFLSTFTELYVCKCHFSFSFHKDTFYIPFIPVHWLRQI